MLSRFAASLAHISRLTAAVLLLATVSSAQPQKIKPAKADVPRAEMPRSERHELKHEIDHLEDNWRAAVLRGDAASMAAQLSDDYVGITAGGTLQSKDEEVANVRTGVVRFTRLDLSDRKIRFYSQTALVTSRAEVTGISPNGPIKGSFRYTRVYIRDAKGAWKVVSFEASKIREP